jgi:glutamate N-acetyltransferase / amino-acid N-acetyltransferase
LSAVPLDPRAQVAASGITAPGGFRAAAVASGIKAQGLDLALVAADRGCAAAGVFTRNRAQAAPVLVSRDHLAGGHARAVVINAGCANAATGTAGLEDARETARLVADAIECRPHEVVVASTGVIGVALPMAALRAGVPRVAAALAREGGADAARAIMTTDTRPKEVVVEFSLGGQTARVGGMAKGAGMIAPNMATMLCVLTTDAGVAPSLLASALREAVGESLNRITVDGDTSTNDMAVVLASGVLPVPPILSAGPDYDALRDALTRATRDLAEKIVRDGEGASRLAEIRVEGAASPGDADRIARTIAESPLVKTALHGGDPNWGRILAAVGRSGVPVDIDRVDIHLGPVWVAEGGRARAYDEDLAHRAVTEDPVRIRVDLHAGPASGWIWTCDLTRAYVDINAHYRS